MAAVRALSFHSFDDAYFALMDKLPLDETKLKLLTYQTHEEKTYALTCQDYTVKSHLFQPENSLNAYPSICPVLPMRFPQLLRIHNHRAMPYWS